MRFPALYYPDSVDRFRNDAFYFSKTGKSFSKDDAGVHCAMARWRDWLRDP